MRRSDADRTGTCRRQVSAGGIIPVTAVALYGRKFIEVNPMWGVFAFGFVCYALAAGGSAVALGGYASLGDMLNTAVFDGRIIYEHPRSGYWIMDYLIEETIELFGAISFLYFSYWYYTVECLSYNLKKPYSPTGA